jgi:hypothetical protein
MPVHFANPVPGVPTSLAPGGVAQPAGRERRSSKTCRVPCKCCQLGALEPPRETSHDALLLLNAARNLVAARSPRRRFAGTNNPLYANAANEAWLDFTTDAKGAAVAKTDVPWFPRSGGARAIIVHDRGTAPGGVAGAKLACLGISF